MLSLILLTSALSFASGQGGGLGPQAFAVSFSGLKARNKTFCEA